YRWLVFAGLLCSLGGDVWLLFPRGFVAGLLHFLVAHLLYIAAFVPGGPWNAPVWALLAPFALVSLATLRHLRPHLGRQRSRVAAESARAPSAAWGPADGVDVDAAGARGEERTGAGVGRRSGRQNVVDEHDRAREAQALGAHGERAVQVPPALGGRQPRLRLGGAGADQEARRDRQPAAAAERARQEERLIEAACTEPGAGE